MSHPYGPPRHPQAHAAEGVAVTTKFFPLFYTLLFFKPVVAINGYPVPYVAWGRAVIPAPPGRHHVHVHVPTWFPTQWGAADATVDVYPGRYAEMEYRAPAFWFGPGSLGPPPQKYNGIGMMIAFSVVPFVLVMLMAGGMFILSFLSARP